MFVLFERAAGEPNMMMDAWRTALGHVAIGTVMVALSLVAGIGIGVLVDIYLWRQ